MKGSSASNLYDTLNHVRCVCVEERQAEMQRTNENDLPQGSLRGGGQFSISTLWGWMLTQASQDW